MTFLNGIKDGVNRKKDVINITIKLVTRLKVDTFLFNTRNFTSTNWFKF